MHFDVLRSKMQEFSLNETKFTNLHPKGHIFLSKCTGCLSPVW